MVVYTTIAAVIGQSQVSKKKRLDYYRCRSGITDKPYFCKNCYYSNKFIINFATLARLDNTKQLPLFTMNLFAGILFLDHFRKRPAFYFRGDYLWIKPSCKQFA